MDNVKSYIKDLSRKYDFDICRFARPEPLDNEIEHYRQWVSLGYNASMHYLDKNYEKKHDPKEILPNVETVIVLGHSYKTPFEYDKTDDDKGLIARYAWGDDYHEVLVEKADNIISELKSKYECDCIRYIDTGPVLERAWAVKSGVGWQGKNGNVINFDIGSYFFICVIFTNLKIEADSMIDDYCGTCKRCIVACPSNAIVEAKVVDSRKCLSYWNIEAKPDVEIPKEIKSSMSNRLFGCDICQEVCPWNNKKLFTNEQRFHPRNGETSLKLLDILNCEQEYFSKRFKNSPIKRKKLTGLKQIAEIIIDGKNQ